MHFYWRIKEELSYLGEVLVFLDPRFVREYSRWVKKRLSQTESGCGYKVALGKGDGK
jgi:hypothetical protein